MNTDYIFISDVTIKRKTKEFCTAPTKIFLIII